MNKDYSEGERGVGGPPMATKLMVSPLQRNILNEVKSNSSDLGEMEYTLNKFLIIQGVSKLKVA